MSSQVRHYDRHGDAWEFESWERSHDAVRRVAPPVVAFLLAEAEARYGPFTPPIATGVCPTCGQVIPGE